MKLTEDGTTYSTDDALKVATSELSSTEIWGVTIPTDTTTLYLSRDGTYFMHLEQTMDAFVAHVQLVDTLGFDPGTTPAIREDLFPLVDAVLWQNLAATWIPDERWIVHDAEKFRDILGRAGVDEGDVKICP